MAISDTGPVKEREFYRNEPQDTRAYKVNFYIIDTQMLKIESLEAGVP